MREESHKKATTFLLEYQKNKIIGRNSTKDWMEYSW